MKVWLGAVCMVPLVTVALLGNLLLTIPLASDDQLELYARVAREQSVEVPWQALVAVDAVRYRQDFSKVTEASIRETAALFIACRYQALDTEFDWRLDYVGETLHHQQPMRTAGSIRWAIKERSGKVTAELRDGMDNPVKGDRVGPGIYVLWVYAVAVPADYRIQIQVTTDEKVCYGRPMEEVMAELGFLAEERELAQQFLNAFQEAGAFRFIPNPSSPFAWPLEGLITSAFGYRASPTGGIWENHTGVDIAADQGMPVKVAADGIVIEAGEAGNYGLLVKVQHDGFQTWYGHLSQILVEPSEKVLRNEIIGAVGSTGRSSGPHLHFEWRIGGTPVDPLQPYR